MQFTSAKKSLKSALDIVVRAADPKSHIPILQNVLLRAGGNGHIRVAATDLTSALAIDVAAVIERQGSFTLPAKRLAELVKKAGATDVMLDYNGNGHCRVASGAVAASLAGIPATDYPVLPSDAGVNYASFPAATLAAMIDAVVESVSTDESRYHLNGAFFECDGDTARMIGTDGHVLHLCEASVDCGPVVQPGVIIPRTALDLISRLLRCHAPDFVELQVYDGRLWLKTDGCELSVKLIDAQFPPYQQVIPADSQIAITADRVALRDSLSRLAAACATKRSEPRPIKLVRSETGWVASANNPDVGEASEPLTVREEQYERLLPREPEDDDYETKQRIDPAFDIGVNASYLINALEALTDDTVRIQFGDGYAPIVARGEFDTSTTTVIMPMRI